MTYSVMLAVLGVGAVVVGAAVATHEGLALLAVRRARARLARWQMVPAGRRGRRP